MRSLQTTAVVLSSLLSFTSAGRVSGRAPDIFEPSIATLPAQNFIEYGAQRVEVRYGPYSVPAATGGQGMSHYTQRQAPKPCSNCLVTWVKPDLIYEDGGTANADTGMWLHHAVTNNLNRKDLACPQTQQGHRWFASGNERTVLNFSVNGIEEKVGYYIDVEDEMVTRTELMNTRNEPQTVYLTLTYEYVPGIPEDFEPVVPLVLDAAGCDSGPDYAVKSSTEPFDFRSPPWKSKSYYRISSNWGHLHDGGVRMLARKNGKVTCELVPNYGETAEYISVDMLTGVETTHLSSMGACSELGYVGPGDRMSVHAFYNMTTHPGSMGSNGQPEPVMGLSFFWLVESNTLPISERLKGSAAAIAATANKNPKSVLGSFIFLCLFGGFAFWVGRRTKKIPDSDEKTYRMREYED